MKPLKYNIYFKVAIIIFIGLLLLIPAQMIRSLVYEREARQRDAISEVSSKWGQQQTLSGPFITIPFIKYVKETDKKKRHRKSDSGQGLHTYSAIGIENQWKYET